MAELLRPTVAGPSASSSVISAAARVFVPLAQALVVGIGQVSRLVVELELAEGSVERGLLLLQLEPAIFAGPLGHRRGPVGAAAQQGPEHDRERRERERLDQRDLQSAHGSRSTVSRRMRSRMAASGRGRSAAGAPDQHEHQAGAEAGEGDYLHDQVDADHDEPAVLVGLPGALETARLLVAGG